MVFTPSGRELVSGTVDEVVRLWDVGTKRKIGTLDGPKSQITSVAISPDGTKVVTVESTTDYDVKMIVLDYSTRAIIKRFDNPTNEFIQMPRWSPDGKRLAFLSDREGEHQQIYVLAMERGEACPCHPCRWNT